MRLVGGEMGAGKRSFIAFRVPAPRFVMMLEIRNRSRYKSYGRRSLQSAGSRLVVSKVATASIGRTISVKSTLGTVATNIGTNDLADRMHELSPHAPPRP